MPATSPEALLRKAARKRERRMEREKEQGVVRQHRYAYVDPAADRDEPHDPSGRLRVCRPAWRIR